jgi:hypothetical protein
MLWKKVGLKKTSDSKRAKVVLYSTFKTWKIQNNYPNVDRVISLFHFFVAAGV